MKYVIIDPFVANTSNRVLEVFEVEFVAKDFLQHRLDEDEDAWGGCLVEAVEDDVYPYWVNYKED